MNWQVGELAFRPLLATAGVVVSFFLGVSQVAVAADRVISAQTATFECGSVKPGDTLTLESGVRGPLRILNCKASATNPITIRNDVGGGGPTVIRRSSGSSGGFILNCEDCVGVVIDGSYKWRGAPSGKTYGIKVTITGGAGPSAFVRIGGLSRFVTIRNIEIDGAWPAIANYGSGIRFNDARVSRNKNPGLWREGILIEDNYIHDVALEGMYIGPNYYVGDLPLRNVEIRNNRVEDTGFDGIDTKSMLAGSNSIHHNQVRRVGKNLKRADMDSEYAGIRLTSGTGSIYNNWIESTGEHGIQVWTADGPKISEGRGPFEARIWNNVIVNAGELWRSFMLNSYGISVGAQAGCEKPTPYVFSNTIVNSRLGGINIARNVGAGVVRDNLIAGAGGNPVISAPSFIKISNNRSGTVADMQFEDAARKNFRLRTTSPARNQGTSDYPDFDFDNVSRPKGAVDGR